MSRVESHVIPSDIHHDFLFSRSVHSPADRPNRWPITSAASRVDGNLTGTRTCLASQCNPQFLGLLIAEAR